MNIEDIKKGMRVKCTDVGTMTRGVTSESKIDNYVVSELIRNTPPYTKVVVVCSAVVKAKAVNAECVSPTNSMYYGFNDLHLLEPSTK